MLHTSTYLVADYLKFFRTGSSVFTMWKIRPFGFLLHSSFPRRNPCLSCQFCGLRPKFSNNASTSSNSDSPKKSSQKQSLDSLQHELQTLYKRNSGEDDFAPKPLNCPLGLPYPPFEGQNTGIDKRSFRQRRAEFVNYDKHIERRKELCEPRFTFYTS